MNMGKIKNFMKKLKKKRKGFTLVEVIAASVIFAIVVVGCIPAFSYATDVSREVDVKNQTQVFAGEIIEDLVVGGFSTDASKIDLGLQGSAIIYFNTKEDADKNVIMNDISFYNDMSGTNYSKISEWIANTSTRIGDLGLATHDDAASSPSSTLALYNNASCNPSHKKYAAYIYLENDGDAKNPTLYIKVRVWNLKYKNNNGTNKSNRSEASREIILRK